MRDPVALAAGYQAEILARPALACHAVVRACTRNRGDLDRQDTPAFPYRFDPGRARRICAFAELLPHVKGPKAIVLGHDAAGRNQWAPIVLEPWQCWILTTLFGWVHVDTGRRRFRVGLILVPRKNAKSTLGAVVALYCLTLGGESGAEVYSAATTRDQAKVVAEIAWMMASRAPALREAFGLKLGSATTRSLTVPAMGSKFAALSAEAHTLDGLNVSCAIVDELHAHKTRGVWDVLNTATGARLEPLLLAITTAGVEIGGICHERLAYLEKILEGLATDESFFGINYTITPGDDLTDPVVQRKANPNLGVSVSAEDLGRKIAEAQLSPAALNNVLTKHFNVWIRTESAWMTADTWQRGAAELTLEALAEAPCWIGVDLGETRDPSSLALVFRPSADRYAVIPKIYLPAEAIARSPIAQLSGWVREAWIIETPGSEADYARILEDLLGYVRTLKALREIDFDRRSARLMMQTFRAALEPAMGRDRVEAFVLDIPQSLETMDPAMKTTEALLLGGKLTHDGSPAMAWMISNIVIERNHKGEIYPRKAGGKDSHNKIDAAVAMFTALSRAMHGEVKPPEYSIRIVGPRR